MKHQLRSFLTALDNHLRPSSFLMMNLKHGNIDRILFAFVFFPFKEALIKYDQMAKQRKHVWKGEIIVHYGESVCVDGKTNIVKYLYDTFWFFSNDMQKHIDNGRMYGYPECCIKAYVESICLEDNPAGYLRRLQLGIPVVEGEPYFDFGVPYVPCIKCGKDILKRMSAQADTDQNCKAG